MLTFCVDTPVNGFKLITEHPLRISGWGFFETARYNEAACFIETRLDYTILSFNPIDQSRPDVLEAYPQSKRYKVPVGFDFKLQLPKDTKPGIHNLSLFALNRSGRRELAAKISLEVLDSSELTFSQRFQTIPAHLMQKVNGYLSEPLFMDLGRGTTDLIIASVNGVADKAKILDFGCGLGRVFSAMLSKRPQAEITAFDIDPLVLYYCRYLYPQLEISLVVWILELPTNSYDLFYAILVFTNLDATTDYWLAEIHRLLKPNGKAFLTYHDETVFDEMIRQGKTGFPHTFEAFSWLSNTSQTLLAKANISASEESANLPSGLSRFGIPTDTPLKDRYIMKHTENVAEGSTGMATFYTTSYWKELLGKFFEVESVVPRGLMGFQSFCTVTKKDIQLERANIDAIQLRTLEQEVTKLRKSGQILF